MVTACLRLPATVIIAIITIVIITTKSMVVYSYIVMNLEMYVCKYGRCPKCYVKMFFFFSFVKHKYGHKEKICAVCQGTWLGGEASRGEV